MSDQANLIATLLAQIEAEKQRADAQEKRAETEKQRADEQEKRAEAEKQRADEQARDTAVFIKSLQNEIQENATRTAGQSLRAYLAQVSPLTLHMNRLFPTVEDTILKSSGANPDSEGSKSSKSPKSSNTTSGRTSIKGKHYPLHMRPWITFPQEQRDAWFRVYTTLQNNPKYCQSFPSYMEVQAHEKALLEYLHPSVLALPGALNAARSNLFFREAMLQPTKNIMAQYLIATTESREGTKAIHFDDNMERIESKAGTSAGTGTGDGGSIANSDVPLRTQPDSVVLTMLLAVTDTQHMAQRIAVGEHKACHAVRGTFVKQMVFPNDYMVRLARESQDRKSKDDDSDAPASATPAQPAQPASRRGRRQPPVKISGQRYIAHAMTQAYHYMLVSGTAYGYLCTGESFIFLHIQEDDPTTLLYHASVELIPTAESSAAFQSSVTTIAPVTDGADAGTMADFAERPIGMMCGFCELALRSSPRSFEWIMDATKAVPEYPALPASVVSRPRDQVHSSLGRHSRHDDDTDDGNAEDGARSRISGPFTGNPEAVQIRGQSQQAGGATTGAPSGPQPSTLAYCTQKCLAGLVRADSLDINCPNHALHVQARTAHSSPGKGEPHPLTLDAFVGLVREQLYATPTINCECNVRQRGAVGFPFKITLTGYGYTFVGKAVEAHNKKRLVRESAIYKGLEHLQGCVIPVCLGLIDLIAPYPVPDMFVLLPHMLLLSYAGALVIFPEDVDEYCVGNFSNDFDEHYESERTMQELSACGLYDYDDNTANFRWCAEVRRAMRIDFDRAVLSSGPNDDSQPNESAPVTPASADTNLLAMDKKSNLAEQGQVEVVDGLPALKRVKYNS